MEKENGNSANGKVEKTKKLPPINVTVVSIIFAFVVLFLLVFILGWSFFTGTTEQKRYDITIYVILGLIGSAVSNIFSALTSHLSQKSKKARDTDMVQTISDFFTEKTSEINKEVSVAVKQNNLVSENREDVLRLLLDQSLLAGEIKRIKIFAHESVTFAKFFKKYFEDKYFECKRLDILVHNPIIQDESHPLIADWILLYNNPNTKIEALRIRNPEGVDRRSFYGIVIDFSNHHPIGLIGFYRPLPGDTVIPYNSSYGVFSQSSILEVLNEYFDYYWEKAKVVTEKFYKPGK